MWARRGCTGWRRVLGAAYHSCRLQVAGPAGARPIRISSSVQRCHPAHVDQLSFASWCFYFASPRVRQPSSWCRPGSALAQRVTEAIPAPPAAHASCASSPSCGATCGPTAGASRRRWLALVVAAACFLVIGQGLKRVVDAGFAQGDPAALNQALFALLAVIVVMAASVWARFYLVSWLGERVVADLRRDVFAHLLELSPAFFEQARTGEVISRLTTDTALLEQVVGTSVSMAVRNTLLGIGSLVMLALTSFKLTAAGAADGAGGDRAHRAVRPARAQALARQPGPHRRSRQLRGRDAARDPHGAGLRPRAGRSAPVRRARRGGVRDRAQPHPPARHPGGAGDPAGVRRHRRDPVDRRPRRAGRTADGGRAVGFRVLRRAWWRLPPARSAK